MQNSITAAQSVVQNGDLATAYTRVREVAIEAEEANLSRSRDIRGPLAELVGTLEGRAMQAYNAAVADYFEGNHEAALAKFEELAALEGLRAAREASGELRKEDDRAEWREMRAAVAGQIEQADFAAAREALRTLEQRARRTGYKDTMDELVADFGATAATHVDQAKQAIDDERYEDAYGTLLSVSRLSTLRAPAADARRTLREHANTPGMRQAQREYESADLLAEARAELAQASGRNADAVRESVKRKLERLATTHEGTRAAEEATRLANEISEQLAAN